jgi:hypothetical protein
MTTKPLYGRVSSNKSFLTRTTCMRQLSPGEGENSNCAVCDKEVWYKSPADEHLESVVCGVECLREVNWKSKVVRFVPVAATVEEFVEEAEEVAGDEAKPKTCSVCGGPSRGRGYRHVEGCSASTAKLEKKISIRRK